MTSTLHPIIFQRQTIGLPNRIIAVLFLALQILHKPQDLPSPALRFINFDIASAPLQIEASMYIIDHETSTKCSNINKYTKNIDKWLSLWEGICHFTRMFVLVK